MSDYRVILPRPPARTQSGAACWAAALASLESARYGEAHWEDEYTTRYKPFCDKHGALLSRYWKKVFESRGLTYEGVKAHELSPRDFHDRMTHGELKNYHLLSYFANDQFHHAVVVHGVEKVYGEAALVYIMNPTYELDDCYRTIVLDDLVRTSGNHLVALCYW